jgi:hypothetical protein
MRDLVDGLVNEPKVNHSTHLGNLSIPAMCGDGWGRTSHP